MNEYRIVIIDHSKVKTLSDIPKAQIGTKYIKGFRSVCEFLGGTPHRHNAGYSALKGNIEYIIQKA